MADNYTTESVSVVGATFKSDDDGTAHWPYVKLAFGADNTYNIVGSLTSNPLPVDMLPVFADDEAFTLASSSVMVGGGIRDDELSTLSAAEGDAVPLRVNNLGSLYSVAPGHIDSGNSSTSTLLANNTFTGTGIDVTDYSSILVSVFADQASATDGLKIQFSSDNSNWDFEEDFTISASVGESHVIPVLAQYMRVTYTNGGTGQSAFRLQTVLLSETPTATIAPLNATVQDTNQALLSKAVISAYNGSTYQNIQATTGGNLKISLEEASDGMDIGAGNAGSETLRVSIATDDVNLSGILADTASLDSKITACDTGAVVIASGTITAVTDITNTIDSTISGDALTALQLIDDTVYSEDVATPATIVGNAVLMERDDALTTVTPIEGDWIGLRGTAEGALWVQEFNSDAILADTANMDTNLATIAGAVSGTEMQVDVLTLPASTNTLEVVGDVAHDAAAAGNPVAIAARATNSIEGLTQVAAADASFITSDLNGCLVVRPHTTLEENISERVSDTAGTSTNSTNFAAGGAGIHNYITSATVYNSNASTSGYVDLRDGSAGSVVWTLPAPANSGCIQTFDPPLKFSANTAVAYDVSAAISTVYLSLNGFQAQG